MNRDSLKSLLMNHEGLRLKPYKDTSGKLTIGYGRCLDVEGISEVEAGILLDNDISKVISDCRSTFQWFITLSDIRQNVISSMVFNLGISGVKEFSKMINAIENGNFEEASIQMLSSKWAIETGQRAIELSQMMIGESFPVK